MRNKPGTYANLKGTTVSSFKIGKTGVELYSAALESGDKKESLLTYKTTTLSDAAAVEKAKIEEMKDKGFVCPDYDIAIPSKNIKRLFATKGISGNVDTLTIMLTNGESFTISQKVDAAVLVLPQDAEDGEIAAYSKNAEGIVTMGKSGVSVTNEIVTYAEDDENKNNKKIPTVTAVKKHLTDVTKILNDRLEGDNVTKKK